MFEFLFLDLDDTILDFQKAEHIALSKTLKEFGLEPTEMVLKRYNLINKAHWEALERKELTREQVLVGRFQVLFEEMGITVEPVQVARAYEHNLSIGHWFLPGAEEAVERLSKKYKLYLASNGTAKVQAGRLASANISRFFEEVFVSQEIGANKPSPEYFERCFARIPGLDKSKTIMVGDSLTSDILGGQNAGIATCWVNPHHKEGRADIRVDYEIESLSQLEDLLESLKREES
jgi:2-haloacid dehalogenase